jgi:hypothetical protein
MKTLKTLLPLAILLPFVVVIVGGAAYVQKQKKDDFDFQGYLERAKKLELRLVVDRERWKVGEDIILKTYTFNNGKDTAKISIRVPWGKNHISVTDENGQTAPYSANMDDRDPVNAGNNGVVSFFGQGVEPGKAVENTIGLNHYFDLSKPGIYKIQVKRDLSISEEVRHVLTSNTITIRIVK